VSYRQVFYKQMAENVREGQKHREAFEALDRSLEEQDPMLVAKWRTWVGEWEAVQHADASASPYELKAKGKRSYHREGVLC
jgi:inhibitor of KinA sporulation pathway (predicted exonuclease)